MKTKADFRRRDTEVAEDKFSSIRQEIPANQKSESPCALYLRGAILLFAFIIFLSGCAAKKETLNTSPQKPRFPIVVYPVENLSGTKAPIREIRQLFIEKLNQVGFEVLGEDALEKFMEKNRIRYTGGLDRATSKAFIEQMGIEGVFIISVELYSEETPPKIGLLSRLVSTGDQATIQWIDGIGMAGDDSPGILSLGLIEDPKVLLNKAVQNLVASLETFISGRSESRVAQVKKRYQPRIKYRSPLLEVDKKYSVAVVPFFNVSERKYAGEVLVLHFVKELKQFENLDVIEPGLVRQELLNVRIIMEDSISVAQAEVLFGTLNVDLILAGKVMDYQDYRGTWGKAKVDFSSQLFEQKSGMVVWSSRSYNDGEEAVYFFDWGKVNTAHVLTNRMVEAIGEMVIKGMPVEVPREEEPVQPTTVY
jgi:TolB-like protein